MTTQPRARRRRSPGPSASCSRLAPPSGRSWSSSTTSTGASRRSSTSSSTSPTSAATRRSCCSAWRGPSCSTCGPPGAAASSNATTVLLEPLAPDETAELDRPAGGRRRAGPRATGSCDAAGGNPLFVEEMVAMAAEGGERRRGAADDPGTAGRAARPARRCGARVLERGAVEGKVFHRGAVAALADARARSTASSWRSCARSWSGPSSRCSPATTPTASATCSSATPPTRRCRRRPAPSCTSASPTGSRQHGNGAGRARRDPRLPPRAGLPLPRGARAARRPGHRRSPSRRPRASWRGATMRSSAVTRQL